MTEPRWIATDEVIALNAALLEGTAEHHFTRDLGGLESAVSRVQNRFAYAGDISASGLVADLIYGIGKAHAFEQGNKRTAWAAGRYFARINGFHIRVAEAAQLPLAETVENVLTDKTDRIQLQVLIESFLVTV